MPASVRRGSLRSIWRDERGAADERRRTEKLRGEGRGGCPGGRRLRNGWEGRMVSGDGCDCGEVRAKIFLVRMTKGVLGK